ncbi:unnamed protein product [Linum tenue]|uniref:Receptor-like serine/threonine-protein kinase n=1 Tax=Linum tenue TaxID=586396 RepID=A0AAV0RDL1_9ROSI|nr:unnamed protein product [Linum tenue]
MSFLLLLLPFLVTPQSNRNVSLGSSLTAAASNAHWVSPSGDFAFGFEQVGNGTHDDGGYLLAVVFDKIPERTVVWSANRNNLAPRGSKVELTTGGRLVLTDPSGRQIWTPDTGERAASHAAMLDTGNFVLAAAANVVSSVWGSFQDPTDTLLPTQALERDTQLIAKYSKSNYSESRFKFIMQDDGNLVMYTTHYPESRADQFAYWVTRNYIRAGYSLALNQSGFLNLLAANGTVLDTVFNGGGSSQDFYHRVTFDYDGVLRYYEHPKRNDMSSSTDHASTSPPDICTAIGGPLGSGACGYNSYCELEDDNRRVCKCPPKYVFQDPSDESRGCVPDFDPEDCRHPQESNNNNDALFVLAAMPKVNWSESNYDSFPSETEEACQQSCLNDCRCALVTYSRETCTMKRSPLSNGRVEDAMSGKSLIKIRRSNSTTSLAPDFDQPTDTILPMQTLVRGSSIFVNIIFVLASCPWRKNPLNSKVGETLDQGALSSNLRRFAYKEMETATGGFKQVLGSGSSGTVYKGVINDHNSEKLVAIKVLDKVHVMEGHDVREFTTEVTIIGETNHKNLTRLVGFCNEGQHRVLVYEFMSNGSLADFLFGGGETRPNWYTRTRIAYSVARGLVYLHEECNTPIIHCDIKPQNILLDCSMTARISDFGLSKLMKANQTRTTTAIRGTKGYLAPEWFRNVPVTPKVDVHSFGIVLLELVCCRKNFMMEVEKEEEMVLVDWAYDCYSKGKLHKLLGDDKDAMEDMVRVERLVKVSIWCIQEDPSLRPSMKKVVHMLEGAVLVSEPPDPNSFMSAI